CAPPPPQGGARPRGPLPAAGPAPFGNRLAEELFDLRDQAQRPDEPRQGGCVDPCPCRQGGLTHSRNMLDTRQPTISLLTASPFITIPFQEPRRWSAVYPPRHAGRAASR